ncbi:molybdopterin dinucleotide binding domain-containing protein [Sporolituus thermophilus]|uniref:Molybdopterin oxidoreductase n=1 Tax=Sporolituus thermophilus DSM 23256 TaxID=1123285 RepID=A0A1G7KYL4_9FIRM|nr:molybdopterin dinucleotide binding domain-containing protein [Sporolituus thermophilus]SDF42211.1 Molybdopterin oxidoreductase [Sporolituus thermophilus DSM 23256]
MPYKPDLQGAEFCIYEGAYPGHSGFSFQALARKTVLGANSGRLKIAVVDPVMQGGTDVPGKTQWIPVKPSTDGAFVLGIMRWILENHKYNASYLECSHLDAAKAMGYNSYSNATHLVVTDPGHPSYRKFLRPHDIGLSGEGFIVIDKSSKSPVLHTAAIAGELFFQGTVDSPQGPVKVATALSLLRDGVFKHTIEEYAKICEVPPEQIIAIANEFSSHGPRVGTDSLAGTVSVNSLPFTVALWMLPALMGAYNTKGGMAINGPGYKHYTPGPRYNLQSFAGMVKPSGVMISRERFPYEKTTEYKNKVAKGQNPYPSKLPWHPVGFSLDGQALFSAIHRYPYQCKIYVNCYANPLYSTPSLYREEMIKELRKTENIPLFISIDIVMGETTAMADYVVPDTSFYEQWAMVPVRAQINTKMTAVRWPVIKPLTPKGSSQPMSMEAFIIDVAKKLGLPGFGKDAIADADGKLWPLDKREDFYLKAVANMAYDENPVPDISSEEWAIADMESAISEWRDSIKPEEWKKVGYVLARGGRFEPDDRYHDGNKMRYGAPVKLCFYSELMATSKNSITGKYFEGVPVWTEEMLADGRKVDDVYPTKDWPFRISSAKAKLRGVSMLSNCPTLQELGPTNYVEINSADAAKHGLKDGQKVKVISPTNQAVGILRVREGVARGTAAIHFGYGKWEYGGRTHVIGGKEVKGDPVRRTGIASNPLGLADPSLPKPFGLTEVSSGTHGRNGIRVRIEPAE